MKIAIVGLGLIGGSIAKAIKKKTRHFVIGIDNDTTMLKQAKYLGAINEIGTMESLKKVDLVFLCIYPEAEIEFIEQNGSYIKKDAIVADTAGIKTAVCKKMTELSEKFQFEFIGSHPMAGKEKNGFFNSDSELFCNASFLLCPCNASSKAVKTLSDLALSIGFKSIKLTDPQEHDRMIAFTSQIPHILACSYVLSPNCINHPGFSAGSYKDVSRVANINAELWSELFLENKEPLLKELDTLSSNINAIINAIKNDDKKQLNNLLNKASKVKKELGE